LRGAQQREGVLKALVEDRIRELPVAGARDSCSVPAIMVKTLRVFTRADG
jgi:hypothetical protein